MGTGTPTRPLPSKTKINELIGGGWYRKREGGPGPAHPKPNSRRQEKLLLDVGLCEGSVLKTVLDREWSVCAQTHSHHHREGGRTTGGAPITSPACCQEL